MLSPARQQALLHGLKQNAVQVYEGVPIGEAWPRKKIQSELHRTTNRNWETNRLDGCLRALLEAGLIKEPRPGYWQRLPVKAAKPKADPKATPPKFQLVEKAPMANDKNPGEQLLALSEKLNQVGRDAASAIAAIADEMVEIAATLDEGDERTAKLETLAELLKDL